MQGSSQTVGQALLYEVAACCSELALADVLLQGHTPFLQLRMAITALLNRLRGQNRRTAKIAAIQPSSSIGDANLPSSSRPRRKSSLAVAQEAMGRGLSIIIGGERDIAPVRAEYCVHCLIVIALIEGVGIVLVTTFFLLTPASWGDPGSPAFSLKQSIVNVSKSEVEMTSALSFPYHTNTVSSRHRFGTIILTNLTSYPPHLPPTKRNASLPPPHFRV